MARLSTHVLDTSQGKPAANLAISLYAVEPRRLIRSTVTNADGRTAEPLIQAETLETGVYEIVFSAGAYFRSCHLNLPDPPFLDEVVIRFGIADPSGHYHVPLLLSPYGYSTYRGS
jgi:5-hydroxyisourate hydrolase